MIGLKPKGDGNSMKGKNKEMGTFFEFKDKDGYFKFINASNDNKHTFQRWKNVGNFQSY